VWTWTDREQDAFTKMKHLMASPFTLAFPNFADRLTLEVDASEFRFGAVLSQKGYPVTFTSWSTRPAEKGGLHSTLLELSAVIWAVSRFHVNLHGATFTLVTYHAALK
jgi:hypothetical protein